MALSNAERKLIKLGTQELRDRLNFNRDIEREQALAAARRAKIGDKYRLKMLEKALKNAGVDYDLIRQRQARESESAAKDMKKYTSRLNANAAKVAQRHQQLFERLRRTKISPHFRSGPAPTPESVVLGYLPIPVNTDLLDMGTPQDAAIAINPPNPAEPTMKIMGAVLTFKWDTKVVDFWNPLITAFFNYVWTPDKDGSLGILSTVAYNGTGSWSFPATCDFPAFLNTDFSSSIAVQQMDAAGHVFTSMGQGSGGIKDSHRGGCTHHSGTKAYDQVEYLELPSPFLVEKKSPVMISITITGGCFGWLGAGVGGDLDFATGTKSIIVGGIFFGFTAS